jgi:hypothetical protein
MTKNQPTLREAAAWAVLLIVLYGALGTYFGV